MARIRQMALSWKANLCMRHSANGKCARCKEEIHIGGVYLACTLDGKDWFNFHPECFAEVVWEVPEAVQAFEKCIGYVQKEKPPKERGISI